MPPRIARNTPSTKSAGKLIVPDVRGMTNKQAAHAYLNAGLMPHPWKIKDGTKVSCYGGFSFHGIRETHASIDKWRDGWQCGLVCSQSSGLFAADVDDKPQFRAWAAGDGPEFVATAWARTGSGGSHLLYDARNVAAEDWPRQGKIPGGDLKSNGFIAVEPSLHPNGQPYTWQAREVTPAGQLAPILAAYRNSQNGHSPGSGRPDDPDVLREACLTAEDGEQHNSLLEYVGELEKLGYKRADIIRLGVMLTAEMPVYKPGRPWRRAHIRELLHKLGEITPDATPEECAILASLPTVAEMRQRQNGGARWHDFAALAAGKRKRAEATIFPRADGQCLFYAGKEHNIYGEAESGKDMLLVAIARWCLENGLSVMWTDFEEGDELEIGSRLLNAGLDAGLLTDRSWFRYATPAGRAEADACLGDVVRWKPDVAIWDGMTAAYGMYGWQVKENDSATAFRAGLVRPCLAEGIATISSDHVAKDGNGGRYAIGGVMKLNMVNGAAYLLEARQTIARGEEGASRLVLTKDRPSGIKAECGRTKDPAMRYAGMLTVKSAGDSPGDLLIDVIPPQPEEDTARRDDAQVPEDLLEKISRRYENDAGEDGLAPSTLRDAWEGPGKKKVMMGAGILKEKGYLAPGKAASRGTRLVSAKPYRIGCEVEKFHVRRAAAR